MKYIGMIKWFDADKGFGVISTLNPGRSIPIDVFIHYSCWKGRKPFRGTTQPLVFEIEKRERGGYAAVNCNTFDQSEEQWSIVFRHKRASLYVDTESGRANILQSCLSLADNSDKIRSFISVCKAWHVSYPENNTLQDYRDYLIGGRDCRNEEFRVFVESFIAQLTFEDRKTLFLEKYLTLSAFSVEECFRLIGNITRKDYQELKTVDPNKASFVIKSKIDTLLENDRFFLNRSIIQSIDHNQVYQEIEELFLDYAEIAGDSQIAEYHIRIYTSIYNDLSTLFSYLLPEIQRTRILSFRRIESMLDFPHFFTTIESENLKNACSSRIKSSGSYEMVISLMSRGLIPLDSEYIIQGCSCLNPQNMSLIFDNSEVFSSELVSEILFLYLNRSNDVLSCLYWYNKRNDIQTEERLALIKDAIQNTPNTNKVKIVQEIFNYSSLLGMQYAKDLSKQYLHETCDITPLLFQIENADEEYAAAVIEILHTFHTEFPTRVSQDYAKAICDDFTGRNSARFLFDDILSILKYFYDNSHDFVIAMSLAGRCGGEVCTSFEQYLLESLSQYEYMQLWDDDLCSYMPDSYLENFYDDIESKYVHSNQEAWLSRHHLTDDKIKELMIHRLKIINGICCHRYFKTQYFIYNYSIVKGWEDECRKLIDKDIIQAFEWVDCDTSFDFDSLRTYFILFPNQQQCTLLKKLFSFKALGVLDFSLENLDSLNNCNPSYMNYSKEDEPKMDLAVALVITSMHIFAQRGSNDNVTLRQNIIKQLIYNSALVGQKKQSTLTRFFDVCTGKKFFSYPKFEEISSFIYPVIDTSGVRWFVINTPYQEQILEQIRHIEGRIWHPQYKIWMVPESSRTEIEDFAKRNRILVLTNDVPASMISKSLSEILTIYDRSQFWIDAKPLAVLEDSKENMSSVNFCEGREGQGSQNKDVWWCVGHYPCNKCNILQHTSEQWREYTLLDFLHLFNLDVSEKNKYGDFKYGTYALFMTSINKLERFLDHLYCRNCHQMLYPVESNYGRESSSSYYCINSSCKEYHKTYYINHCYTLRCRGVVDSRDTKKCPNGLVICAACGTCCTTDMFRSRLQRLIDANSQFIPSNLISLADNNAGHLDNNIQFCYHCGKQLNSPVEHTYCQECGVEINYMKQKNRRF